MLSTIKDRDDHELHFSNDQYSLVHHKVKQYNYSYPLFIDIMSKLLEIITVEPHVLRNEFKKRAFKEAAKKAESSKHVRLTDRLQRKVNRHE